jgi:hemerythrin superfamily protein
MKELLASDHAQIEALQFQLFAAFEKRKIEEIFAKLDVFWARLAIHIRAEHRHLFPAILKASRAQAKMFENQRIRSLETVESAIEKLHQDHDFFMKELGLVVKQLRGFRNTAIEPDAGQLSAMREKFSAVSRRLTAHNELEEGQVYQWAEELLDLTEQRVLKQQIQAELENLPPRFAGNRNGGLTPISD